MRHREMLRNPLTDPRIGDVVQSAYFTGERQIGRRLVTDVTQTNVVYLTGTGRKTVERHCLPAVWRKWCRQHKARVVTDQNRDY